jgi:hypothetical protein
MLQSIILVDPEATLSAKPSANTYVVDLIKGENVISVEQIRGMMGWLRQFGFEKGKKRAIVLQAQRWHFTAPEALLKTLEEPADETDIILTVNHPTSLSETIRSRCATLAVEALSETQLLGWGLTRHLDTTIQPPFTWGEVVTMAPLERWILLDPWLKNKADLVGILAAWEKQTYQQLRQAETTQRLALLAQAEALSQAQQAMRANVATRLVIDAMWLQLFSDTIPASP